MESAWRAGVICSLLLCWHTFYEQQQHFALADDMVSSDSAARNGIKALIEDELRVVTFKSLAKRFNIPYDVSKQVLYNYLRTEGEARAAKAWLRAKF
jgi:hypothetical protein